MSHELPPLSIIKSLTQYLAPEVRGPVTEEQEEYLDRIEEAADYLDTLITDTLDFARLEAGPVSMNLESVPVQDEAAQIRMRDTGMGIPPEEQAHIFVPFVQAQASESSGVSKGGWGWASSSAATWRRR